MGIWLREEHTTGYYVGWKIKQVIHQEQTEYQYLEIVEFEDLGRALVLDGAVQTTLKDEFIYHEMIAHVPLHAHPNPLKVLVVGGGDGGTVREILKHKSVQRVDVAEIDRRVVETCREFLPELALAFDDPRVQLMFVDGIKYARETSERYDVIIIDSSDPIGPAMGLFSEDFYRACSRILNENGMMVAHAESPMFYNEIFLSEYQAMSRVFPVKGVYLTCVPSYISGFWAFVIGSKKYSVHSPASDKPQIDGLKYYSDAVHQAAFVLPAFIANQLT